ncbi:MAG: DEAD/DEAH box helicase, partial [Gammaproteobacteria bacterium]|nr:DEAD/DEAH box helicase [Gammaproteobacteria bacterium]
HFDRWWNPAVENQATDRAFRIGQRRNVLVHKFMTTGTVEERIDEMIAEKRKLADDILAGDAEVNLTELSDEALMDLVRLDVTRAAS